jgi:MFS family permease
MLAFLCAIFVVYTIDRALLGLLAKPIMEDLGVSKEKFSLLSAAVFWTYALVVPFAGFAGDRFNRARIIGLAAVAWSLTAIGAGFAGGFSALFALAAVSLVVPQTFYGPSANAFIASCHCETRTMAMSLHQAAYYTGWLVSGAAVAAVLALSGTWRAAYWTFGGIGLALGSVFLLCARAGKAESSGGGQKPSFRDSLRAFFCCPSALLASVCYVVQVFAGYGYGVWGTTFIAEKFGLSNASAGTGVMFWHFASSLAAILVAGAVTDRFIGRFPRFRPALSAAAAVCAVPALAVFALSGSLAAVWAAAAVFGAALGVIGANQFTIIFDFVPPRYRAASVGFLNVVAGLIGSLAPIALARLSEAMKGEGAVRGFEVGFAAMGALELLAVSALLALIFFTFKRDTVKN